MSLPEPDGPSPDAVMSSHAAFEGRLHLGLPTRSVYDDHRHIIREEWPLDLKNAMGNHIDGYHRLLRTTAATE